MCQCHPVYDVRFITCLTYLVLAPPPDVSAEGELLLVELVPGEHVVELVHREVDDLVQREGDPDLAGLPLVARLTDPEIMEGTR